MNKTSYKIKHDFLFREEDQLQIIPKLDSSVNYYSKIKLSDVLEARTEEKFSLLLNKDMPNVLIMDDVGECQNPNSIRYKEFIIRCVYNYLSKRQFNVYLE